MSKVNNNLNLRSFIIDDDGDLCVTMEMGTFRDSQKLSGYAISGFIKDVKNAVHGVSLSRKLAEWLLDKEPTIFDRKEVIIIGK